MASVAELANVFNDSGIVGARAARRADEVRELLGVAPDACRSERLA